MNRIFYQFIEKFLRFGKQYGKLNGLGNHPPRLLAGESLVFILSLSWHCPKQQQLRLSSYPEVSNNLDLASDFPRAQISVALFWVFPGLRLISPLWRSFPGQETSNRHTSRGLINDQTTYGVGIQPFFCKLMFRSTFLQTVVPNLLLFQAKGSSKNGIF